MEANQAKIVSNLGLWNSAVDPAALHQHIQYGKMEYWNTISNNLTKEEAVVFAEYRLLGIGLERALPETALRMANRTTNQQDRDVCLSLLDIDRRTRYPNLDYVNRTND